MARVIVVGDSHQEFADLLHGGVGPVELAAMEGGQLEPEPQIVVAALHALAHELDMLESFISEVRERRQNPRWGIVQTTADGSLSIG